MLHSSFWAFIITLLLALAWLRVNTYIAARGWVSGPVSRKIIHIGTGPIFVLCWLLYPESYSSRFWAALIPLGITVQFLLVGLGLLRDEAAVVAMTRHGLAREILRGPLFYGIVFVLLTILYWYDTPIGLVALMLLCGGDGLADLIGKRVPSFSLPWSRTKTIAGSLAMLFGGWGMAALVWGIFILGGTINSSFSELFGPLFVIALLATVIESLPLPDVDNLTVPAVAVLAGHFLLS
jgi:phytol kinase